MVTIAADRGVLGAFIGVGDEIMHKLGPLTFRPRPLGRTRRHKVKCNIPLERALAIEKYKNNSKKIE